MSKNEWDTKEGPGKSMKNVLYVQQHGKKHLSATKQILSYAGLKASVNWQSGLVS